jgi:hypothetical protein
MDNESIKIKCEVFWAQLDKMNDMSGKYQFNLGKLSDKAVEALEGLGLSVNEKEDMGKFIVCKSNSPMRAYDTDNDQITEKIGNGSKAKAIVKPYDWSYKNKKGKSPSLVKLVITDLVEYASADSDIEDDEVL